MINNFFKSTFILLLGGFITKIFSTLIKITISRLIGSKGLSMYMLVLPTLNLLISLSQFGIPIAISKLVSEDTKNNKKLLFSTIPIIIITNLSLIIIVNILAPYISNNLLKNKDLYISIIATTCVIPFTTISNICRAYFFGKEKMFPHIISNITEDLVRFILTIIFVPKILKISLKYTVCFIILTNVISELASTLVLLFFLPKNTNINKNDLIPNKTYIKETLKIGIPNTTSRLIGSIGYFLEPIILTHFLSNNYSNTYISHEYAVIQGYVMPIILLPSFFTLAISQALLPIISKEYIKGNKEIVKKRIKQALSLTLLLGITINIFILINTKDILNIIYKTNKGITYLKILAPITILQYLQSPLSYTLEAIGKSKINLTSSLISTITRTISLIILSNLNIGMYSLIISISINIIFTTTYLLYQVNKNI